VSGLVPDTREQRPDEAAETLPVPGPVPERLLDAGEVAERLHVPASWVREEARANRLPCVRLGRYVRFSWPDVLDYLTRKGVKRLTEPGRTAP
jgi:excisionase family DNA binding protein